MGGVADETRKVPVSNASACSGNSKRSELQTERRLNHRWVADGSSCRLSVDELQMGQVAADTTRVSVSDAGAFNENSRRRIVADSNVDETSRAAGSTRASCRRTRRVSISMRTRAAQPSNADEWATQTQARRVESPTRRRRDADETRVESESNAYARNENSKRRRVADSNAGETSQLAYSTQTGSQQAELLALRKQF